MAKKQKLLNHVSYIIVDDKPPVRWDTLPYEKRLEYSEKMMETFGKAVATYFKNHPEELERYN